jgi:hypothetical protein
MTTKYCLGLENDMSSITETLARIDNSLEQHNIDSSSCMQRVICSYVNEAQKNMQTGEANTLDQFIYALSKYVTFNDCYKTRWKQK